MRTHEQECHILAQALDVTGHKILLEGASCPEELRDAIALFAGRVAAADRLKPEPDDGEVVAHA
jgi:hypothetical protein